MELKVKQLNEKLAECIAMCNYCFDACLHEQDVKMMAKCIKLDKECAEICCLTLSQVSSNSPFSKALIVLCADACQQCADECKKHNNEHCRECAKVCEECAKACKAYAA